MKNILHLLFFVFLTLSACTLLSSPTAIPTETATVTPMPQPTDTSQPTATIIPADICLQGDWELNNNDAAQLLAFISSTPSMVVREGVLRIKFDEINFSYHSEELVVRSTVQSGFLDANATLLINGTYTITDDQILFTQTDSKSELTDFRVVDEKGEEHPFITTDSLDFEIPESATFSCTGDELTLTFSISGLFKLSFVLSRMD
jgi:hypothetical protein